MFRTKLTLAGLAVAALVGAVAPGAFAAHDSWYSYATSLTNTQRHDPSFAYAVSLTEAQPSARLISDTRAPGGGPSVVSAPVSNGFDWADAGIGAGATAGIALLLLASGRALQS